jgi:Secretion system C-terminal sorting domain/Bacterial pre-peptidase C-terminal domain
MKKRIIFLSVTLFSLGAFAQERDEKITSIYELMSRRDLNLKTVEKLADDYFKIKGKERGSGYKQYMRWLFDAKFHVDKDWNFISPQKEAEAYEKFFQNSTSTNNKSMAAPVGSWTDLGPFSINRTSSWAPGFGRLTAMAIHPSNLNTIYVGSPGGGIWKSTNGGGSWQPLTDNNALRMHIFSLAIDPANQSIIYAGTGNFANQVIKSTDGGTTWTVLGSGPTGEIRKILIHPTNSSIVFAAASNGVYRSTNGGTSWTQVDNSYKEDIEFKPNDPNIMMASGSNIIRSTNNGVSWTLHGTAQGITNSGRTLLAVSPNNANYVYAVQANGNIFGRLYLSTDGGVTFTTRIIGNTTGNNFFGYEPNGIDVKGQAGYDMAICASPTNANEVHIGGIITWKSTNAGTSFTATTEWIDPNTRGYTHCDMHGLEFVGSTIYTLSDGGLAKSTDNGDNFSFISTGLGIKQFYNLANSNTDFSVLVAGSQDNGAVTRNSAGVYKDWIGADAFECLVSPTNPLNIWSTIYNGEVRRSTDGGQTNSYLTSFGGSFYTHIAGHPTNENIIFGAGVGVFKSTNGGLNFSKISGTSITTTLSDIAVAQSNPNYIYACSGSTLYVTINGGTNWNAYIQPGTITDLAVSPSIPTKLWFTTNTGGVYVLTNAGANIVNLTGNLPSIGARTIAVDYSSNENIYVGMNEGVYTYSNNDPTWTQITSNMPRVAVNELEIQKGNGTLRAATFGRGIWEYTNTSAICATAYEPNDVTPQFMFKNTNVYAAITSATDVDRYEFKLSVADKITVVLRNLPANYNIELRNSAGTLIGSGNNTGTTDEVITINSLAAGTYTLRVFGSQGVNSPNCYALEVRSNNLNSRSSNPNGNNSELTDNASQYQESVLFPNPANNELNVDLNDFQNVSTVLIMSKEGKVFQRQDNVGDLKGLKFDISNLSAGIYFVQILSVNGELKTLKLVKE